ncbi:MAG: hotdog fold thioesterase, partial [Bacteroidota bacterium]
KDHFSRWMELKPLLIEEGHCRLKMTVRTEMLNGFGLLHGGVAYAFADSAFAFASNSYGRVSVSIQGSMNFAQSAKVGAVLIAEASPLHLGYKTADFDVKIYPEDQPQTAWYSFRGTVYRSSKEILTP